MNEWHWISEAWKCSLTMGIFPMLHLFSFCTFLLEPAQSIQDPWLTLASRVPPQPALKVRLERNADFASTMEDFTSSRKLNFPGLHGLA